MKVRVYNVESSTIQKIGYSPETETLYVVFSNERMYRYDSVPASVVAHVIFANSIGKAFDQFVKKGGYKYKIVLGFDFALGENNGTETKVVASN